MRELEATTRAVKYVVDRKWTQARAAKKFGVSQATVSKAVARYWARSGAK